MKPPVWLEQAVADVPDFPKPGIRFKDMSALWRSAADTSRCSVALAAGLEDVDVVVGIEARGFLAGLLTAQRLGVGFIAARKPGKLPGPIDRIEYDLEYGTDCLEIQSGSFAPGDRVVIVDDVIATGGTAAAAAELVSRTGATVVEIRAILELSALGARQRLAPHVVRSLWEIAD